MFPNLININKNLIKIVSFILLITFPASQVMAQPLASYATSSLTLPPVGTMINTTPAFEPTLIKGVTVFPDNPLRFDFIVDTGDSVLEDDALKSESNKLIKYFLASLTVPEEDLWVNLSPYEAERIIPEKFGHTEMGRDLLAQDYILKQLTASLMYPEDELGEEFWDRVHEKAYEEYGVTDIPVNTFNKVWIVPEKAEVYENSETNTAFVVESCLKVMLEEDYFASQKAGFTRDQRNTKDTISTEVIRDIIIPEIEKEVNEGTNFAQLRQIYHSLILATWFKRNLKESILGKIYVRQNKIDGVDIEDKQAKEKIYTQYLEAFKQGAYDYIKEDYDQETQQIVPRKYFSGGLNVINVDAALIVSSNKEITNRIILNTGTKTIAVNLKPKFKTDFVGADQSMMEGGLKFSMNDDAMRVEDETGYSLLDWEVSVNGRGLLEGFYRYEGTKTKRKLSEIKQRTMGKNSDEFQKAIASLKTFIENSPMYEWEGMFLIEQVEYFEKYFEGEIVVIDHPGDLSIKLSSEKILVLSDQYLNEPLHFLHSILVTSTTITSLMHAFVDQRFYIMAQKFDQYFRQHGPRGDSQTEEVFRQKRKFWAAHALLYQLFQDELRSFQFTLKGRTFDPKSKRELGPDNLNVVLYEVERILKLGEPLTVNLGLDGEKEKRELPLALETQIDFWNRSIRFDVFPISINRQNSIYQERIKHNFPELVPIANASRQRMEYYIDDGEIFYPHQGSLGMINISIEAERGGSVYGLIQENQLSWEFPEIKSDAIRRRTRKFLNAVHLRFAQILDKYYGLDTYAISKETAQHIINYDGKKVDPTHLPPVYTTPYMSKNWKPDVLIPPGPYLNRHLSGRNVKGYKFDRDDAMMSKEQKPSLTKETLAEIADDIYGEDAKKIVDQLNPQNMLKIATQNILYAFKDAGYDQIPLSLKNNDVPVEEVTLKDLPYPDGPIVGIYPDRTGMELAAFWATQGKVKGGVNFVILSPFEGVFRGKNHTDMFFAENALFFDRNGRLKLGHFNDPIPIHAMEMSLGSRTKAKEKLEKAGIPMLTTNLSLEFVHNKIAVNEVLKNHGVKVPEFIIIDEIQSEIEIEKNILNFMEKQDVNQVFIKPYNSFGGQGVLAFSREEVKKSVEHTISLLRSGTKVIIQERKVSNFSKDKDGEYVDIVPRVFTTWDFETGKLIFNNNMVDVRYLEKNMGNISNPVNGQAGAKSMTLTEAFKKWGFSEKKQEEFLGTLQKEFEKAAEALESHLNDMNDITLKNFKNIGLHGWDIIAVNENEIYFLEVQAGLVGGLDINERLSKENEKGEALIPVANYLSQLAASYQKSHHNILTDEVSKNYLDFPDDDVFFANFLTDLMRSNQYEMVEVFGKVSVNLFPQSDLLWMRLGAALQKQGKFKESQHAFEKALEINQNLIYPWFSLMQALNAQSNISTDELKSIYLRAVAQNLKDIIRKMELVLHLLVFELGWYKYALEEYLEIIEKYPVYLKEVNSGVYSLLFNMQQNNQIDAQAYGKIFFDDQISLDEKIRMLINKIFDSSMISLDEYDEEGINTIYHPRKISFGNHLVNNTLLKGDFLPENVLNQKLIIGNIDDIALGGEDVIRYRRNGYTAGGEDSLENYKGLKNLVYIPQAKLYVMDNDTPFYMWHEAAERGDIDKEGNILIYVDQHADFGTPHEFLKKKKGRTLKAIANYAEKNLTIVDNIQAAVNTGLIDTIYFVSNKTTKDLYVGKKLKKEIHVNNVGNNIEDLSFYPKLTQDGKKKVILHVDLDYFNDGDLNKEIDVREIKSFVKKVFKQNIKPGINTIATSPGFVKEEDMVPAAKTYAEAIIEAEIGSDNAMMGRGMYDEKRTGDIKLKLPDIVPRNKGGASAIDFLSIFTLGEGSVVEKKQIEENVEVYTIQTSGIQGGIKESPKGLEIFRELVPPTSWVNFKDKLVLDLIYITRLDNSRELIAILPRVPEEADPTEYYYFDLSEYYVPYSVQKNLGKFDAINTWVEFAQRANESQNFIKKYLSGAFGKNQPQKKWNKNKQTSFVYVELNPLALDSPALLKSWNDIILSKDDYERIQKLDRKTFEPGVFQRV